MTPPPNVIFVPAPAASGFAPTDIAGCISWFDAADASSVTVSTGVSNWSDKSGNIAASPYDTGDFVQPTSSLQPAYTTAGINGKNVITFDGSDDVLLGRLPYNVVSGSLFIVSMPDADPNWVHMNRGSTTYTVVGQSGSSSTVLTSSLGTPTHYVTGNAATWTTRNDVYLELTNNVEIYEGIGYDLRSLSDGSGTSSYNLCGYGSGFNMAGDVAEIVIYNTSLSSSDRETVEGYLAHKWGISANLPASHPFKSVAP